MYKKCVNINVIMHVFQSFHPRGFDHLDNLQDQLKYPKVINLIN